MMLKHIFMTAAALSLAACTGGADHSEAAHNKDAAAMTGGVEVSSAFIKPPFTGRTTAAAFMQLDNKGADTRLVSASTPISPRVEIHTHLNEDGVMKMRRIEGIDIAAGETVQLKPGGYHLMMFDTVIPEGETDAPVTLTYADGTEVTMIVPFGDEAPEGDMDHSKMDHSAH